ncbi:hypothetical protein EMIHUDRAFT_234736 [Emiliania huxleyi CCMP1516]|uniref:Uncharacterized protein n=2 Tax=Emiliania huxleyi TaxID=2903 RepID=A0A0D3JZ02_EMIH1|nr:hypothetical protein EMIHUDRAFT_234736 [Emiliania huxleyi CCMP1516]EOD28737.1 hypothetical protein EMIHUDRAFT_234736 [Emiliania huxleyi CCMP1516]|eukprot:XP_005781166.1 hypothetical protein EMIHUDRAFT_234736 [Emiliania huxleyi CCMP1516]
MRMLFLVLAARSGAGVAGSELLQRREWPRGVVLGLSRGRDHYAVLAAAHGAASAETEPQQRLQAVQHNASGLSGAMRRLADLCDGADPWARDAQSARVPVAESAWLARSAKAFPAFWALPRSAQYLCCADGRPRCGLPRVAWEPSFFLDILWPRWVARIGVTQVQVLEVLEVDILWPRWVAQLAEACFAFDPLERPTARESKEPKVFSACSARSAFSEPV